MNAKSNGTEDTPLIIASQNGHKEIVELLLEHGTKVNSRNRSLNTPLDYANENGHEKVVQILKAYGAC